MVTEIPALLKRRFVVPYAVYKTFLCKSSYLRSSGWLESLRFGKPVGADGGSLPWMNYPVIQFLESRLNESHHVFEFGSGYSTKFYANLAGSVTSVEYDAAWCKRVAAGLPDNAELIQQPSDVDGDYCRTIERMDRKYDVVVVDGRDRVNCVRRSMRCLTDSGVILLDDSSRSEYQPAIEAANERGFRAFDFVGIKPTSCKAHQTTLLYRDKNCLGL